jgi:hypothetical protein
LEGYPVLAKLWDNEEDAVFDDLSGITRTAVPDGPTVIAEVTNQAGSTAKGA